MQRTCVHFCVSNYKFTCLILYKYTDKYWILQFII